MSNDSNGSELFECLIWDLYNQKQGRIQYKWFSVAVWVTILIIIISLHSIVIYVTAKVRENQKSSLYVMLLSTFMNQLIFALGTCVGEIISSVIDDLNCTTLKFIYFFEALGKTLTVFGLTSLTILQYLNVISQQRNNQMSTLHRFGKRFNSSAYLVYIWTISIIITLMPIIINEETALPIPSIAAAVVIILYVIVLFKLYTVVNTRVCIKHASRKRINSVRCLQFVKGSGVLLVLTWIPLCAARFSWYFGQTNEFGDTGIYILSHVCVTYPIFQPLLYVFVTREVRAYFCKRTTSKCTGIEVRSTMTSPPRRRNIFTITLYQQQELFVEGHMEL